MIDIWRIVRVLLPLTLFVLLWLACDIDPVAAQTPTITPTATITATSTLSGAWMFPEEGLHPYTYTQLTDNPLEGAIESGDLWHIARTALTTYNMIDAKTWALLALVILIPTALALAYKIFTRPPEI